MTKEKKIILFIVEGITEKYGIGPIIKKYINDENVSFQVVNNDLTFYNNANTNNIIRRVGSEVKKFLDNNKAYKIGDIFKIVQLVDIDGVFLDDKYVLYNNVDKVIYKNNSILCNNTEFIINRNKIKTSVIKRLISTSKIRNKDYRIYFFSSNLEHVFFDNANVNANEKIDYADKLSDKYIDNISKFIEFITSNKLLSSKDYNESWNNLINENKKIVRASNFGLFFINKRD